ncbi:HD-GYP domain-containing protein (c-di-GMP phosphodiesterase class II) [Desulfobaculum xiamenense]|uniref:HD-GYP domain-containing protein (C-di-GMP phosphodiesterase class II) n=1 Tax=Desulfobaculum xiamenense TaxID=995050 RepID=A0A846QUE0_9BACT|nr:HD domain-containing phosphohydrolase [Desulfobaculum xiamenense]NJB69125.1 HD-GYP domain-containing protein (c-di-GMP phosphodiesterase class II) [Desulfobaculum xiamenense]
MKNTCPVAGCPGIACAAHDKGTCDLATCLDLRLSGHDLAQALGNAVDAKDHSTHTHSEEVAAVSRILARELGMSSDEIETIHIAGHLHDIGKIGIPDDILRKPGPLTPEEWLVIKRHPTIGADIVQPIRGLAPRNGIAGIIRHHHERWDGSGYPRGLAGHAIPVGARVIAVADSLSAMLQHRPYCRPKTFEQALADIRRLCGVHYDPEIVAAMDRGRGNIAMTFSTMRRTHVAPRIHIHGLAPKTNHFHTEHAS